MSNVEHGMLNYEVLSLFCKAVPILVTKIEINWLFSFNNASSFDSGFIRFPLTIMSNHILVFRNSFNDKRILWIKSALDSALCASP